MPSRQTSQRLRSFSLGSLFRRFLPPGFEALRDFAAHKQQQLTASSQGRLRAMVLAQKRRSIPRP